jgi:tRNA(fMet)-specific endonuclease VapC
VSFLLDTNVCIALMNADGIGTSNNVRTRFLQSIRRGAALTTSPIVAHQLWYGVAKSQLVAKNARALSEFLCGEIKLLDYTERDAQAAGEIRAELERQGQRIGEYDTLIAGHAFSRNLVLVTANTREFGQINGLIVEDWTE